MNAIEPVAFEIEGSEIDPSEYQSRIANRRTDWSETSEFIFTKSVPNSFDELSYKTLLEDFRNLVDRKSEPLENIYKKVAQSFDVQAGFYPPGPRGADTVVFYKEDILIIPNPKHEGYFYIISNNKNYAREIREKIIESIQDRTEEYAPLGLEDIKLYTEEEFTHRAIKQSEKVDSVSTGDANEFEKTIYGVIKPISTAFSKNVTVSLDSPQEPEYDMLFALSPESILNIEVEDHSGSDSEPTENDLIDNPSGSAELLGINTIFTVVKGASDENLGKCKKAAQLRKVDICEKEQCNQMILQYIKKSMVPETLGIDL